MEQEAYFLVVDLEATCDENHRIPHHEMETIEVGAVLVDGESLEPVAEFQSFVRPRRHPILRPFCTRLTSITQPQVASAPLFPEVMEQLRSFLDGYPALFCSWGDYDRKQLLQDASFHRARLPFDGRHFNVKQAFAERLNQRPSGMAQALRTVGLRIQGTHHRGIDDARNIARLLPWALGRAAPSPPRRSPR
jgi:inhibitor of KinA sporulation pathway (predicted exonuclease)